MIYDHESDIRELITSIRYRLATLYTKKLKKTASDVFEGLIEDLDKIIYNADMITTQKNNLIEDNKKLIKQLNVTKEGADTLYRLLEESYDEIASLKDRLKKRD